MFRNYDNILPKSLILCVDFIYIEERMTRLVKEVL